MNIRRHFLALTLLALAAPSTAADVHARRVWVPGPGQAFAISQWDLDDATGVLSVWADYSGLPGPLTGVTVEEVGGVVLIDLSHEGGMAGFTWGSAAISDQAQAAFFNGGLKLFLHVASDPPVEMSAGVPDVPIFSVEVPFSPDQVEPGLPSQATGTAFVISDFGGEVSITGYFADLSGDLVSLEVRGPAYYGQDGPFLFEITEIGHNGFNNTFFGVWDDPSEQQRQDLKDGLIYLLIRSTAFPDGELRAQLAGPVLGDAYCEARPNSVLFNGAGLWAEGSVLAGDSDVSLQARFLPPNKPVLPIVGFATGHAFNFPGTSGTLCLAGASIVRLNSQIGHADAQGLFTATVDLANFPPGAVQPGDVLNFQLWYRDVDPNGGGTSNFSNAVSIRFR